MTFEEIVATLKEKFPEDAIVKTENTIAQPAITLKRNFWKLIASIYLRPKAFISIFYLALLP